MSICKIIKIKGDFVRDKYNEKQNENTSRVM